MPYAYAQLPIYHYHTFDRRNLQFTPVPVFIPPPPPPPPLEVPVYPHPDSDNDGAQDGAGDEATTSDDAPPDPKSGRHHLILLVLSSWAGSLDQSSTTNLSLNQEEPGPPDETPDTAPSGETPSPGDEAQVNSEEAQANAEPEPTTTDSEPLLEGPGSSEGPEAALDVPNWAADDQGPKEAVFPPIEPVVGSEGDAGHKEPDGGDHAVSILQCADPPSLLF